ncbi:ketopantoate reductase family protein [Halobacillus sp. Nhm2S1]|uniref:ketopantoate reductase family protein n=1 Tax=Halobacillus sp. Nhm2S1 TaxID=2866716 RepID=UPI001C733DD3|nr:2-dehydropantoate 2-reductase [Halobacillus sp. Nhm2S1]MBX0357624.1 2-dehydropantoate 2-reductase [Halobacillus sp. Nhm2S1]
MNIAVAGAGAVGCYFGGRLAKAGYDVTFLARGGHLAAMQENGLRIKEEAEEYIIESRFTDDIRDLSEADLVLFCVKSNDTKRMADALQPILKETAAVMTLQNGVENEEILEEVFGATRVLSAVTYVQSSVVSPGEIKQQGRVKLVIGSLSSQTELASIIDLLQAAGIDCGESSHIMSRKWNKLMWNATFNPLSAVSGARVGEILEDEQLYKTAKKICEEVVEVGIHKGLPIDPETTISKIFSRAEFAKQHQTSMLQDRLRGKPMEVEAMCGYIRRQGELLGVETPANQSIYSVLNYMNQKLI